MPGSSGGVGGGPSAAGGSGSADNGTVGCNGGNSENRSDDGFSVVKRGKGGKGGQDMRDSSGLASNRQRGFSTTKTNARVPTTNLNAMQAKEGALVSKFMTFLCRKNTFVVDLYEAVFFRSKPTFDLISEFIYKDLCADQESKNSLVDVQLHPVKMLLFIKFSSEESRDSVNEKVQSQRGVTWTHYGVRVKGYNLDAQVKRISLLGAGPETTAEDIKNTFQHLGIGEVVESRKGLLDPRRLPGVTNGCWALRVKLTDPDKEIPSYIHRRDEGETWSLNYDGRRFVCWKCGSPSHIGDRCDNQGRTFDEIFNGSVSDESFSPPTWAAVVRTGVTEPEEVKRNKQRMEAKLKEINKNRDK